MCPEDQTSFSISSPASERRKPNFFVRLFMTMGPGLMVCFADTDGSCLITAADSGSNWRYELLGRKCPSFQIFSLSNQVQLRLLLLQFILIPILFFAQALSPCTFLCSVRSSPSAWLWGRARLGSHRRLSSIAAGPLCSVEDRGRANLFKKKTPRT